MLQRIFVFLLFFVIGLTGFGQFSNQSQVVDIKGSVRSKSSGIPIPNVTVESGAGLFTKTNALGEYKIKVAIGDYLIFSGQDIETKRHTVTSDENIVLEVENFDETTISKRRARTGINYQLALDSAQYYKESDIEKSIEFVAKAMETLNARGKKKELSQALTILGEVYLYHGQHDLAISNLEDAHNSQKTIKNTLLLGQAYLKNRDFTLAKTMFDKLVGLKRLAPIQRIAMYEGLGDTARGLGQLESALEYYKGGLTIAEKNQVAAKVIDLNSKIADAFAAANRTVEAQGYYNNSLRLSQEQTPQRAVQESEKVADFYNNANRFDDEIQLRKESLKKLEALPENKDREEERLSVPDSITSQRINYKIANAYISQDKLSEAIPFLERSIVEANKDDDLVVQKDATRKLSEVYRYKGDFDKAFENYQKYGVIVDSLYVIKEQEISRLARLNREITSKQNRISSLEQERELSQSKYNLAVTEQQLFEEQSKRQLWVIYSLLFAILLLTLAAFFYYRSNNQQKLANNLLALKSLRSQMNPHFIFNALNSVNNYIAKNDERNANRFLSEFSTLMRTVLENSEEDFIPLSKELELLQLYVKLEHSRFPDKFDYEVTIDQGVDVQRFEIPPMLLQPYIENAIWHGLRYKEEKGFLKIKAFQPTADLLQIEILDNGIGREKSKALKTQHQKKQRSKGMGNIKKRITILNDMYKNKVDVTISDLNDNKTGTKVILVLKAD